MRWLQWGTIDLATGMGGVEVHARSLARELRALGVEASFSSSSHPPRCDVLQTHGSMISLWNEFRWLLGKGPLRVHTVHGSTLGRMKACREWFWPGGYLAALRELVGVLRANVVLSVHPNLGFVRLARALGKQVAICWNGWNSTSESLAHEDETLPEELLSLLKHKEKFWVYVGRGSDPVKGVKRLRQSIERDQKIEVVAAPGDGFEGAERVVRTGRLNSNQIHQLLARSQGLVLSSFYEGLPLVVLEALSEGIPVVTTPVGGVPTLPKPEGLHTAEWREFDQCWSELRAKDETAIDRKRRAQANREILPTWESVAKVALDAVRVISPKEMVDGARS